MLHQRRRGKERGREGKKEDNPNEVFVERRKFTSYSSALFTRLG
jgi:hypothetical protein